MKKEIFLEWIATLILIIGVALSSFDVYPMNIWISMIGNGLWIIIGIAWKKWPLILLQILLTLLNLAGLLKYYLHLI